MKTVILIVLSLIFLGSSCKDSTQSQTADCDPGYHPCENNDTFCCIDTTSHSMVWEIDTLGSAGTWSVLHDAAIIDEDDIWAVGDIYIIEEDGEWTHFNAVHWNGDTWEHYGFTGDFVNGVFTMRGIWISDTGIIWFSSGCGIYTYDGIDVSEEWLCDWQEGESGIVSTIYGFSTDDIFFVGDRGTIVHFDGSTFTRMESGTDITLYSISGTGYENVWASGWVNSNGDYRTTLLHFDGFEWRTVIEYQPDYNPVKQDSISGYIRGVYTINSEFVYVLTHKGLYKCPTNYSWRRIVNQWIK